MKTIPLSGPRANGRVVLVDDEDYDFLASFSWKIFERENPGHWTHGPYAWRNATHDGRAIRPFMHTLITGWPLVDHQDHNGLNNQRSNLRPATTAQNNYNKRPHIGGSSRFKGVTWHKQLGKWQAGIKIGERFVYLGVFASEEEAAFAYDTAALEAYGEYAYLNGAQS